MRFVFLALVLSSLAGAACGNNNTMDAEPYATMQDCFDDHHNVEGLSVNDAIVVCCLDHPLGTAMTHPSCGAAKADCVAYLGSDPVGMLSAASASSSDVDAACCDYFEKKTGTATCP